MVGNGFISFGEILFDCFGDVRTLGGAPLNVSAHLSKLGLSGRIVSAVGDDMLGRDALREISSLGLSTDDIAVLQGAETGRADIVLSDGNADYEFNFPAAWDSIPMPASLDKHVSLIYFGTLAQRSISSRDTLRRILSSVTSDYVFFDVNLRKNFYSEDIIRDGLKDATILKMNDDEVPVILREAGCSSYEELISEYSLSAIIITEGKKGSTLITSDGKAFHQAAGKATVADTVGAGDSLSAGFLSSLISGMDMENALKRGSILADYVVSKQGAIPEYDDNLRKKLSIQ